MHKYFDFITDSFETLVVTRKFGDNIVIMSEEAYNNLIENNDVRQSKANYDWILESMNETA